MDHFDDDFDHIFSKASHDFPWMAYCRSFSWAPHVEVTTAEQVNFAGTLFRK